MKKFISLFMVLTLVFCALALSSCDKNKDGNPDVDVEGLETLNGQTPEQIYDAAMESLKLTSQYEIETNTAINMTYGAESMTMNQKAVSKVNGQDIYSYISDDMNALTMESWYVDGVLYAEMDGEKIKTNLDMEQYMQQYMGKDPSESTLLNLPESWFKDIKFYEKNGLYTMEFVISAEEYDNLLTNAGLGSGLIEEDVVYTVYFDGKGNLSKIITVFSFEIQGITAECVSTTDVVLTNVTVTPPANADSFTYVEMP